MASYSRKSRSLRVPFPCLLPMMTTCPIREDRVRCATPYDQLFVRTSKCIARRKEEEKTTSGGADINRSWEPSVDDCVKWKRGGRERKTKCDPVRYGPGRPGWVSVLSRCTPNTPRVSYNCQEHELLDREKPCVSCVL